MSTEKKQSRIDALMTKPPMVALFAITLMLTAWTSVQATPDSPKPVNGSEVPAFQPAPGMPWGMSMTREDAGHVRIRYQPTAASAVNYAGAKVSGDGAVLGVRLKACMVNLPCWVDIKSEVKSVPGHPFWYEVVIPYQGEKVIVQPDDGRPVELPLTD